MIYNTLCMQLAERKSALLSAIINEHILSEGQTVASKVLVDKHNFKLSPATIRNEMADLEQEGYIFQPHTSAGRIPTEKGWKYYIENHVQAATLSEKQKKMIDEVLQKKGISKEIAIKQAAKQLAELSKNAVFVGLDPDNYYYTGLSYLFRQPEFQKIDLVCHISEIVDHMDETIKKLFDDIVQASKAKIMVGSENPFGKECSSIMVSYQADKGSHGVLGILGPMRMNYNNNLGLIEYTKNIFND